MSYVFTSCRHEILILTKINPRFSLSSCLNGNTITGLPSLPPLVTYYNSNSPCFRPFTASISILFMQRQTPQYTPPLSHSRINMESSISESTTKGLFSPMSMRKYKSRSGTLRMMNGRGVGALVVLGCGFLVFG